MKTTATAPVTAAGDGVGYQIKVADFSWGGGGKVGQRLRSISSIDMYLVFCEVNKAYCICEVNHLFYCIW